MSEEITGKVTANYNKELALSNQEIIRVQILNSDGSVQSTRLDVQVPSGKTLSGNIILVGQLSV